MIKNIQLNRLLNILNISVIVAKKNWCNYYVTASFVIKMNKNEQKTSMSIPIYKLITHDQLKSPIIVVTFAFDLNLIVLTRSYTNMFSSKYLLFKSQITAGNGFQLISKDLNRIKKWWIDMKIFHNVIEVVLQQLTKQNMG